MNFITLTAAASTATDGTAQSGGILGMLSPILMMVALFAIMYFFMIRPQKKKQKEEDKMRNNLQPGDEIMTIGGFYGKVISVKEDTLVIESVVDRSKQKIVRSAVQQNLTIHDETDDK